MKEAKYDFIIKIGFLVERLATSWYYTALLFFFVLIIILKSIIFNLIAKSFMEDTKNGKIPTIMLKSVVQNVKIDEAF